MKFGFWGVPNSNINWCEEDYGVTHYIAEFWNSVSNLPFLLLCAFALYTSWRLDKRFTIVKLGYFSVGLVAFGSLCFHSTLRYYSQLLDELPMIYGTCIYLYGLLDTRDYKYQELTAAGLIFYSVATTLTMIVFKAHYLPFISSYIAITTVIVLVSARVLMKYKSDPVMGKLLVGCCVLYASGFILWVIENTFCDYVRPFRFHAWWHVLAFSGVYLFSLFAAFAKGKELGASPRLEYELKFLPVTVFDKV